MSTPLQLANASAVTKQRDALLNACKGLMEHYVGERNSQNCLGGAGEAADKARAAIALCEKGTK